MDSTLMGVLVVAGAAALALALRATSRGDESVDRPMLSGQAPEPEPVAEAEPGEEPGDEFAVLSSDGWTFVPFGDGVRLWAPAEEETVSGEELASESALGASGLPKQREARKARPAVVLSAGDLVAARVVRGTPGEAPWCIETLGRDREYSAWSFETEEAAGAAREMLERLVVKPPLGPDGEPEPVGDAEIEEARRIAEETLRELASGPESEPPPEAR